MSLVLSGAITGGALDLGAGDDTLILANVAANTLTVSNIETLTGGTGNDLVTLGGAFTGAVIDLGSGADSLTLANTGTNTVTISNIETLVGGTGNDIVTLGGCDHRWHAGSGFRVPIS